AVDPDPARDRLRVALSRFDVPGFEAALDATPTDNLAPSNLYMAAQILRADGKHDRAARLLNEANERGGGGDFLVYLALGHCHLAPPGNPDEALRFLTAARPLRRGSAGAELL